MNTVKLGTIYAHRLIASNAKSAQVNKSLPRPFKDIPGPRSLPVIGSMYKYVPIFGEYSFKTFDKTGLKKLLQYGPLVKEEITPGVRLLWVFSPEDICTIFRIDSNHYPCRRSHLPLYKYRKDRSSIYNTGGLLPTNGLEWWNLRKEFQKALSKPQDVASFLPGIDQIITEFSDLCKTEEEHEDFLPLLARLFLELICFVAFGIRTHSFSDKEMKGDSRSSKLIKATFEVNSTIVPLDNGLMLWQHFDTPLYKKSCKAQSYIEQVAIDLLSQTMHNLSSSNKSANESLIKTYLNNPSLDHKDIVGMAVDLLLAGVDTASYTVSFALYHLANNQKCQEALHNEANLLLKKQSDPITTDILKQATYTKAVIKETFRMNPISIGVGRILQTDTVLSGYHVPKGTIAVTQNQVICRLPEHFEDPNSFVPERWLQTNENSKKINPFLSLPFGHGPRSCIARRLAEQQIQVILLRMFRDLEFTWLGGRLNCKSLLVNMPDAPLHFKLRRY